MKELEDKKVVRAYEESKSKGTSGKYSSGLASSSIGGQPGDSLIDRDAAH